MAVIRKKAWGEYFQKVLDGTKKFDLRLADFSVKPGDILVLEEYNPDSGYTGRKLEFRITYILKTKDQKFWPKEQVDRYGFQVMQLEPIKTEIV